MFWTWHMVIFVQRADVDQFQAIHGLVSGEVKYPENFFLLRGNHESPSICRIYGFYDECKSRYNIKIWKTFCPLAEPFTGPKRTTYIINIYLNSKHLKLKHYRPL